MFSALTRIAVDEAWLPSMVPALKRCRPPCSLPGVPVISTAVELAPTRMVPAFARYDALVMSIVPKTRS